MSKRLSAVDLFSGAGGISLGLHEAGYDVLCASDFDAACSRTHQKNFKNVPFLEADIRQLSAADIRRASGIRPRELDLLIGGPPCQGFSIIGARALFDPRNDLFKEYLRIAKELQPRALVMENVPGLATLGKGSVLDHVLKEFSAIGYDASFAELLAAQYGVPQMRWRMIFIAFRSDLNIPTGVGFPLPTHGTKPIGSLIPNCPISPEETRGFLTTFDAIGDLPPLEAGTQVTTYSGTPKTPFQTAMRKGAGLQLFNHYAPKMSAENLARIAALKAGQDWRDLPFELLPDGMKRAKRKDHTRRYSRMTWDGIPRSIITRFRDPKSGEYSHPDQTRTISIREAARIQAFPDKFVFEGTLSQQYDQVGNAVPTLLISEIAKEIRRCLRGEKRAKLINPFSRRPGLQQRSFAFNSV